jgi:deazaflavin-dependent oxidoreductase (nitroreductase family)
MSTIRAAVPPRRRGPRPGPARLFNRLVLRFAGTRFFPLYGVIEHRGRRSGRSFRTPVVVRPTADGFVVPMPWGEHTDWYRNVRAAGGCVIRWKGRDYPVVQPELVDAATLRNAFGAFERAAMSRFGITQSLRLRHRT